MNLVSSFEVLLQQLAFVMTIPTFTSFVTLLTGWVFSSRRNITGMICAAGAVRTKHHSAYHRVFAAARWKPETGKPEPGTVGLLKKSCRPASLLLP